MPNYMIAYHGEPTQPNSPEEGAAQMAKWKAWLADLGDAVVNPGSPLGKVKLLSSTGELDDHWPNQMSGFSVIKADSFDSALEMAKACPYLEIGGTLKVAELIEMPM